MRDKRIDKLSPSVSASGWKVLVLAVLVIGIVGCSSNGNNRVSFSKFKEMLEQRNVAQAEAARAAQDIVERSMNSFYIGPKDVVSVTVTPGDQITPGTPIMQRVRADGTIDLPLVGTIKVAGLGRSQAEEVIQDAYMPKYFTQAIVHVEVPEPDGIQVLVVGAVEAPGLVHLRRNEQNLLYAVDRAGGSTNQASGRVSLRRFSQPGQEDRLNLRSPEDLREALALAPLENGDIVMVHASQANTIFVGGLVAAPGPQIYRQGSEVTALQALVTAGGGRMDLVPHDATLIRRIGDKDVHVKLDIERMMEGEDENFALAAGDILWVPHTTETRVREFLNEVIYVRAGISTNYSAYYSDAGSNYHGDLKDNDISTFIIGP